MVLSVTEKWTFNLFENKIFFKLLLKLDVPTSVSHLPHRGWRPGRCGCHRWSPGRLQQTPSLHLRWRATHRRVWHCGTRRWPSQPRGCDCWHSCGLSGPTSGSSSMEWSHWCYHWRAGRSPDITITMCVNKMLQCFNHLYLEWYV